MANILVVDDEKSMRHSLSIALEGWGHNTKEASSGKEAVDFISKEIYDIVVTDLVMEGMDGIELLQKIKDLSPSTEVLLMSAHGTIDKAVEAMKKGASDFITKPFSMDHMKMILEKLLGQMELKQTVKHLKSVLADHYLLNNIVAESPVMREIMHQVTLVAGSSAPVLIQGESGVGKEVIAIAIHSLSSRAKGAFVPINCGAFPETLLDSELFGHCRGAFTGATANKRGLIEEADRGTLFLDEIGEAPPAFQIRLLRFLDNGQFRRVGEVEERRSNARIIAATNKDLNQYIKEKKFREDLYYRLSVAVIKIPPLRERKEDIPPLSQHFLQLYSKKMGKPVPKLCPEVCDIFKNYSWPGNVRELENTIEHALIVSHSNEIRVDDLPTKFLDTRERGKNLTFDEDLPLKEIEKKYIFSVLKKTKGNKKKAAEILKISRTTLISRLKSYSDFPFSNEKH